MTRKCAKCKCEILIDRNNIEDVIFFNKLYYHQSCFEDTANQKATSKRGKPQIWKDALVRIGDLEAETKKMLEHLFARDELNVHLLENYNITMIPTRFWQIVADLEGGIYKGKRCKPVSVGVLCGCWKWGQRKLNEISQYNKSHNKGPVDDSVRLLYDLAILIGKLPNYLAYKEKQKAAEVEIREYMTTIDDVDMSRLSKHKNENRENINDIFNDIF